MAESADIFAGYRVKDKEINEFLEFCESQTKKSRKNNKVYQKSYAEQICKAQEFVGKFRSVLSEIPLQVAISYWLQNQSTLSGFEDASAIFKLLIESGIINLVKSPGKAFTLEDQSLRGHGDIMESIRCLDDLSIEEKERIVGIYLYFANHLAQVTLGYVPSEEDPDKKRVCDKVISYEKFIDFSRRLSDRDAMIAALMYFGESGMSDVLKLKVKQIDFKKNVIVYGMLSAKYPKHIMMRLKKFGKGKKANDLIFVNRIGELVNRSRLYTSFKNASAKMTPPKVITPAELLEKVKE